MSIIFIFFTVSVVSIFSFSILVFSLYTRLRKTEHHTSIIKSSSLPIPNAVEKIVKTPEETQLTHSLLLEILPSNSPNWATLFSAEDDPIPAVGSECGENKKKKKKRRGKKKRTDSITDEDCGGGQVEEKCGGLKVGFESKEKLDLVCLYPFTSSSSATQRKIKQQYDQLVKSHESKGLTLVQVGQFVNCLIEARNELQHKSEVIQRKFTITKALLFKADRSSFDRLRQQIYKLELEQKRLEEDAFVYNWLQQELKLSPAYKKMLEIGACMELKAKSGKLVEKKADTDFGDISFEELLAQEKKDVFWQKNGKVRSCSSR
jgi:hypothetical protein